MAATVAAAQASFATGPTNSPPVQYLSSTTAPATAALVDAPALHAAGITGAGVTIAMLDTGFSPET
jgi:subtilisin family serine protease